MFTLPGKGLYDAKLDNKTSVWHINCIKKIYVQCKFLRYSVALSPVKQGNIRGNWAWTMSHHHIENLHFISLSPISGANFEFTWKTKKWFLAYTRPVHNRPKCHGTAELRNGHFFYVFNVRNDT